MAMFLSNNKGERAEQAFQLLERLVDLEETEAHPREWDKAMREARHFVHVERSRRLGGSDGSDK